MHNIQESTVESDESVPKLHESESIFSIKTARYRTIQEDGMGRREAADMNSSFSGVYGGYLMPRFGSILYSSLAISNPLEV